MSKNDLFTMTPQDYAGVLVDPPAHVHKHSRGRLLIVAGSAQYPGAALLTALGAARSGAGYITLATAQQVVPIAQTNLLTVPVVGLATDDSEMIALEAEGRIEELAKNADALVIGPGIGGGDETAEMVRRVVVASTIPTVIDADGINAFIGHTDRMLEAKASLILTPHEGERARLGVSTDDLASETCIVVAKGPTTTITDRMRTIKDATGPSSLATAGTGDVLSGIIGALLCQGIDPYLAAATGVRLHSTAALIAIEDLTANCLIATDVIDYLPDAFRILKEGGAYA